MEAKNYTMTNWTTTALTTLVLLTSMLLIGVTVADVITDGTTSTTTEQDYEQMVEQIEDEISTYIQIKDLKGKYIKTEGQNKIEKIAILISPLITQEIDISQLTIQLDNGEYVRILTHQQETDKIGSNNLFEHPLWGNITTDNYGLISINDKDSSISEHSVINENTDYTYIIIKLPIDMKMDKYDTIQITLFPSTGITRTINLKAPLPIKSVITFE